MVRITSNITNQQPIPSTEVCTIEPWYDRQSRNWIVQRKDVNGYQIGSASLEGTKDAAIRAAAYFYNEALRFDNPARHPLSGLNVSVVGIHGPAVLKAAKQIRDGELAAKAYESAQKLATLSAEIVKTIKYPVTRDRLFIGFVWENAAGQWVGTLGTLGHEYPLYPANNVRAAEVVLSGISDVVDATERRYDI